MTPLLEARITRHGNDRVYLRTADGLEIGHVDLSRGCIVSKTDGFDNELLACLQRWSTPSPPVVGARLPQRSSTMTNHSPTPVSSPKGLKTTGPPDPVAVGTATPAPNIDGPTHNRRVTDHHRGGVLRRMFANAKGAAIDAAWDSTPRRRAEDDKVAIELAKLEPQWRVIRPATLGAKSDADEFVVIGPSGVFAMAAKYHRGATASTSERGLQVNGFPTDYLSDARHRAKRTQKVLTSATGKLVAVRGVIVLVGLTTLNESVDPFDVWVTTSGRLLPWLHSLPAAIDPLTIEHIANKASFSTTWS